MWCVRVGITTAKEHCLVHVVYMAKDLKFVHDCLPVFVECYLLNARLLS